MNESNHGNDIGNGFISKCDFERLCIEFIPHLNIASRIFEALATQNKSRISFREFEQIFS